MAALTFQYRSLKNEAPLEARLSYTHDGKRFSYYTRSKVKVAKDFWDDYQKRINFRDVTKSNLKKYLDDQTDDLRIYILSEFEKTDPEALDKDWLKKTVHAYYHPPEPEAVEIIPRSLLGYWDYYLNLRKHELQDKIRSWQKWITVKHKVQRFQEAAGQAYEIKDVNEAFKRDWVVYCKGESYSNHTIQKEFSYIKSVCTHARTKGIIVSPELNTLKIRLKKHGTPKVYLSFDELKKVKAVAGLPDYLDNARDWLLISCYTGQRVSDFMRFTKAMIRQAKGKTFLDVKQVKTGKEVTIPLLPEVVEVMDKRTGEFPRPISHQRYNDWIKEVCKKAGLTTETQGGISLQMRKVLGKYPKWQLVTSHIGRRSFATNYYGKIPTTYLKNITGHGTEQMLLAYIGKSSKDTAFEAYELLLNANP